MEKKDNIILFNRFNASSIIKQNKIHFYVIPESIHKYLKSNCSNRLVIAIYLDLFEDNCREFNSIPLSEYASLYNIRHTKFRSYLTELEKLKLIKLRKNKMEKNKLTIELIVKKSLLTDEMPVGHSIKDSVEHKEQENILNFSRAEIPGGIDEIPMGISAGIKSFSQKENPKSLNNNINNNINNLDNIHDHILNSSTYKKPSTYTRDSSISRKTINIESLVTSTKTLVKPILKSESKSLGCTRFFLEKEEKEKINMNDNNSNENQNDNWRIELKKYEIEQQKRQQKINKFDPKNIVIEVIPIERHAELRMHNMSKYTAEDLEKKGYNFFDLKNGSISKAIYYHFVKRTTNNDVTAVYDVYDSVIVVIGKKVFSIDLYLEHIKTNTDYDIKPLDYKKKIIELIRQNNKKTLEKYFRKWQKFSEAYETENEDNQLYTCVETKETEDDKNQGDKLYWHYKHCPQLEMLEKYDLSTLQKTFVIYYYMQRKSTSESEEKPFFYKGIMIQVGAEVFYIDNYLNWRDTYEPIEHKPSFKNKLMKYVEQKNNEKLWNFYIGFQKYHEEIVVIPREHEKYKEKKQAEEDTNALFAMLDIGLDVSDNKINENISTKQKTEYITKFRKDNVDVYKVIEDESENAIRIHRKQCNADPTPDQVIDIIYNQIKKFEKITKKPIQKGV